MVYTCCTITHFGHQLNTNIRAALVLAHELLCRCLTPPPCLFIYLPGCVHEDPLVGRCSWQLLQRTKGCCHTIMCLTVYTSLCRYTVTSWAHCQTMCLLCDSVSAQSFALMLRSAADLRCSRSATASASALDLIEAVCFQKALMSVHSKSENKAGGL